MNRTIAIWLRSGEGLCVVLLAAFFLVILFGSIGLRFAPAFFPRIVGVCGLIFLIMIAIQALNKNDQAEPEDRSGSSTGDSFAAASLRTKAIALAAAPIYGVIFLLAGFYVSAALSILGIPALLGYRRPVILIVLALSSTVLIALLFSTALDLQMPHGLIGDWFLERFVYLD